MASASEGSPDKPERPPKAEGEVSKLSSRKKRSAPVIVAPKDESHSSQPAEEGFKCGSSIRRSRRISAGPADIRRRCSLAGSSTNRVKGAAIKSEKYESSCCPSPILANPSHVERASTSFLQQGGQIPPSQARDKGSTYDYMREEAVALASGVLSGASQGEMTEEENMLVAVTSTQPPPAPGTTSTPGDPPKATIIRPQSGKSPLDDVKVTVSLQNIPPPRESGADTSGSVVKPMKSMVTSPSMRGLRNFDLKDIVRSPRETFNSGPGLLLKNEFFMIFVALATMLFVLVAILFFARPSPLELKKGFCVTDDCRSHGSLLKETRSLKVDPCHDFSAHVCMNWAPPKERKKIRDFYKTAMDDMMYSWLLDMKQDIVKGSTSFPVFNKPLAMFESCMGNSSAYGSDLRSFRHFLDNISLLWPNPPKKDIDALSVLLSLAYKWQAAFWFELRVFSLWKGAYRGRRNIMLTPAPLIAHYRLMHDAVIRSGKDAYFKYWMDFYNELFGDPSRAMKERALMAAYIEGNILETLHGALQASSKEAAMFPIGELEVYTSGISSSRWMKELQHVTALNPKLIQQDVFTTTNVLFLQTVGNLFAKYTNNEILDFLGVQFAQHYGPVSDSTLLVALYGDHGRATNLRPAFYGFHIEVPYRVLLVTAHLMWHLTETDKEMVDAGFSRLVSTAVRLVNESTWLESESVGLAVDKLRSAKMRLWPPAAFLNETTLDDLFQSFPEKEESFGAYFIKSRQSIQTINRTVEYDTVLEMPENYALPYFEYDYFDNAIGVAIAAVGRPLFYSKGTLAMFYGGFGFHLALELVKAMDQAGTQWHPDGRLVESFLSSNSQAVFHENIKCFNSTKLRDKESVFPEIPALQVAYSAFLDAANEAGKTTQISADLTEEKVFFLTICYMTCARQDFKNPFAADCNKIVRHSSAFAKAFGCAEGSRMNPRNKCTFF